MKTLKMNRETWLWEMTKKLKTRVFKPAGIDLNLKKIKPAIIANKMISMYSKL